MIKILCTELRKTIQAIAKRLNALLLKLCPETRCWFVRSVNKTEWLSNGLRRCAGKALLQPDKDVLAGETDLLGAACKADLLRAVKKGVGSIGHYIIMRPKLKKYCTRVLLINPSLYNTTKGMYRSLGTDQNQNVSQWEQYIVPNNLSPSVQKIYTLFR